MQMKPILKQAGGATIILMLSFFFGAFLIAPLIVRLMPLGPP